MEANKLMPQRWLALLAMVIVLFIMQFACLITAGVAVIIMPALGLSPAQFGMLCNMPFLAGVLFRKGWLRRSRVSLCIFGALAAIVIYGGIMNPTSALMWAPDLNGKILLTYYISGFPMDCIQAAATWLFLWFAAEPMLEKLDRIKVKYGLVE